MSTVFSIYIAGVVIGYGAGFALTLGSAASWSVTTYYRKAEARRTLRLMQLGLIAPPVWPVALVVGLVILVRSLRRDAYGDAQ